MSEEKDKGLPQCVASSSEIKIAFFEMNSRFFFFFLEAILGTTINRHVMAGSGIARCGDDESSASRLHR